jgi:hypothetical protein
MLEVFEEFCGRCTVLECIHQPHALGSLRGEQLSHEPATCNIINL